MLWKVENKRGLRNPGLKVVSLLEITYLRERDIDDTAAGLLPSKRQHSLVRSPDQINIR
jgi:hypothetical protein